MRRKATFAVAAIVTLSTAVPALAGRANDRREPVLSVTGEGRVAVAPDMAVLVFAVETTGTRAESVSKRNAERARAVVNALKDRAGPKDEIRTTAISVEPRFERRKSGPPEIAGYVARNEVRVETHDLASAGAMIDAAIAAGANHVRELRFDLSDPVPAQLDALREASLDARRRARAVAQALGLRLGAVRRVRIGSPPVAAPRYAVRMRAAAETTPVEPGALEVQSSVQVDFAISEGGD